MKNNQKIPEGWSVKKISDLGATVSGGTPDTNNPEYWDGDVLWVTPSEVSVLQNRFILNTERKITERGLKQSSAKLLPVNSLIICTRATIGDCCINKKPICTNQGFKNIIVKGNNVDFLYYLVTKNKHKLIRKACGSTFLEISKKDIDNLKFAIPPLAEQEKIAEILSCWDEAIEKLSDLIEQKKLLKKGLMQKLLTGKTRLPGFTQPWKTVKLGEIGTFISGSAFPDNEQGGKLGIPFYKVSDMNNVKNLSYMTVSNNYVTEVQVSRLKLKPINHEAIIFAKVGAAIFLERKRLSCNFLIDNNMMAFIPFETPYYIKSVFDTLHLSRYVQVGALPSYNANDLKPIKITIPSDIAEQKAIADVLQSCDLEIEKLKTKLDLLKLQKKGLMQQLLTGKIRVKVDK